jgi:hypothetical protein
MRTFGDPKGSTAVELLHDRYDLLAPLGSTAHVWRATDRAHGMQVAVRIVDGLPVEQIPSFDRDLERFRQVDSTAVASVLDGAGSPRAFVVSQLIDGLTLAERLRAPFPFLLREILEIGRQVAAGIAEMHRHSVVHAGISPDSVVVRGLTAVVVGLQPITSLHPRGWLGEADPRYVAPELLNRGRFDQTSDLYALGAILRRMVTWSPGEPDGDAGARDDAPAELMALIEGLTSTDPLARPDAAEAQSILGRLCGSPAETGEIHTSRSIPTARRSIDPVPPAVVDTDGIDPGVSWPSPPPGGTAPFPGPAYGVPAPGGYSGPTPGGYGASPPGGYPAPPPTYSAPPSYGALPAGGASGGASTSHRPSRIEQAVRRTIRQGRLTFAAPDVMRQGQMERVEIGVARDLGLDAELAAGFRTTHQQVSETVPTSDVMVVELVGDAFAITALSPAAQVLTPIARWEFEVTPLRSGKQRLTLKGTSLVTVDGVERSIGVPAFDRDIKVVVDVGYGLRGFLAANWQWIVGTVVGLGGAIAAWIALFS